MRIQSHLMNFSAALIAAALLIAGPAIAQGPADPDQGNAAAFRAELAQYLYDLEQLPVTLLESIYDSPLSVLEAQQDVGTMTDAELLELKESLDQIPYWRSLPRLLAASVPTQQYFTPLELAASLDVQGFSYGPEQLRGQILDFVKQLERAPAGFPAGAVSADYNVKIASIRSQVMSMNAAELIELQQGINERSADWTKDIRAFATGSRNQLSEGQLKASCNAGTSSCGGSFPSNVICEINNVIKEIVNIPCYVADYASQAVQLVLDGLIAFFELLASAIPSPQSIVSQLESTLTSTFARSNWHKTIFYMDKEIPAEKMAELEKIDAVAAIPCPISLEAKPISPLYFPLLGDMGSLEGSINCQRRALFIADIVKGIFPSDVATIPLKVAYVVVQAVYYIVDYLCLCFEAAFEIKYDDDQEAHRGLVTDRFTDSGGNMIKVSDLGQATTLQSLQNRIDGVQSQVAALDTSVDNLNNDLADVDADVVVVNGKLATSLVRMSEAVDELEAFIALALRMRMEADLVREGDGRIGLFQLPNSQGGYLEDIDAIVEFLINERAAAGRDQSAAILALNKARTLIVEGAYKKAYSQYRQAYRHMTQSGK